MCEWGNEVTLKVPIPASCSHTGEFRWDNKPIDECLAPLVQALNDAGLYTGAACCGHGKQPGFISLHDGTILTVIRPNFSTVPYAEGEGPKPKQVMKKLEGAGDPVVG